MNMLSNDGAQEAPALAVVGLGFTGRRIARMLLERGENLAVVVDLRLRKHVQYHGLGLGDILCQGGEPVPDLERANQVPVVESVAEALAVAPLEVALVSTASQLPDVTDVSKELLQAGVNVLTTAEMAVAPRFPGQDEAVVAAIDVAGRAGGASFYAGGVQDALWMSLAAALSGSCLKVSAVHGRSCAPLDSLGPSCWEAANVGKDVAVFEGLESDNLVMAQALFSLAEALGLAVTSVETSVAPAVARVDITVGDRVILAGQAAGSIFGTRIETAQGVVLTSEFAEKVSEPGDDMGVHWRIEGAPSMELSVADANGDDTTATALINRIPDILVAPDGYCTLADLSPLRWHAPQILS